MINSRSDLISSLDDGLTGVLAKRDEPNNAAMGAALGRICGVSEPGAYDDATERAVGTILESVGDPDHIVVLMLDGFGMNFVDDLPRNSFVRNQVAMEMTSVLPTSTGPNLMCMATGRWPAEHGNLGWHVHIPRLGYRITPLRWKRTSDSRPLNEIGFTPQDLLLAPILNFGASRTYTHITDDNVANSTATRMFAQTRAEAVMLDGDIAGQMVNIVQRTISAAEGKTFTYIYWREVDGAAHANGVAHPITRNAVNRAVAIIVALAQSLEGKGRLLVTADHGHLDCPEEAWRVSEINDPLRSLLSTLPAGENRILFFHTLPGQEQRFHDEFMNVHGDRFVLVRGSDAIEMDLFGDPAMISDEARARVGNFVAVSRGRWAIGFPDRGNIQPLMKSTHGGITSAESLVPVIIA